MHVCYGLCGLGVMKLIFEGKMQAWGLSDELWFVFLGYIFGKSFFLSNCYHQHLKTVTKGMNRFSLCWKCDITSLFSSFNEKTTYMLFLYHFYTIFLWYRLIFFLFRPDFFNECEINVYLEFFLQTKGPRRSVGRSNIWRIEENSSLYYSVYWKSRLY